jgi:hypothetical protein
MEEQNPEPARQLTVVPAASATRISATVAASIVVPAIVAATIRNKNTRMAYLHAVSRFFAWCEHHRIGQFADIEPLHVAAYIETMHSGFEKPSVKQHPAPPSQHSRRTWNAFARQIKSILSPPQRLRRGWQTIVSPVMSENTVAVESPRTTKLYDRAKERLTQDEVDKIRL